MNGEASLKGSQPEEGLVIELSSLTVSRDAPYCACVLANRESIWTKREWRCTAVSSNIFDYSNNLIILNSF